MYVTRSASRAVHAPVALTIGNFDGVHRGHQAILSRLAQEARARNLCSCVMTFEPHPREYFGRIQGKPQMVPTRLSSLREKLDLLRQYAVERVHIQRFSAAFAALTPERFVRDLLDRRLAVRWIMVGEDFCFGAQRAGNFEQLRQLGSGLGIEVAAIETQAHQGVRVSSGAVRSALAQGELERARQLLGRAYSISGRVVHGDAFGRELGYATANVQMQHNRPPLMGIFAVRLHGIGAEALPGVASLGVRPTVTSEGAAVLEVHLFDFSRDIYGSQVRVEFLHKIRDEEKYPDAQALRAQIARDCDVARSALMEKSNG